ncbi:DUF1853 family protein [Vibrio hangzhouensis]|nr:DUF1853 family protein [Vibrio hangzhouensis]
MQTIKDFITWISESQSLVTGHTSVAKGFPKASSRSSSQDYSEYLGNPRLGFLYQELCRRLFEQSDSHSVFAEEIQLQHDGRTLGAIDFLIEKPDQQQLEHWEVAIKFYLLKDGLWYGPNAKDRLDKKVNRMLEHQLKMSDTPAFKAQFPDIVSPSQHLLMQGRLYINPFDQEKTPTHCLGLDINPQRITGYWCYQSQFHRITEPLYPLTKPLWAIGHIGDTRGAYSPVTALPSHFIHCQSQSGQFWFVVPDDWPQSSM